MTAHGYRSSFSGDEDRTDCGEGHTTLSIQNNPPSCTHLTDESYEFFPIQMLVNIFKTHFGYRNRRLYLGVNTKNVALNFIHGVEAIGYSAEMEPFENHLILGKSP